MLTHFHYSIAKTLFFPFTEGFGRSTSDSGLGNVYIVTNLNDSGSGSVQDALSQPDRIAVSEAGGIIHVNSRIVVSQNIIIAGQTTPGEVLWCISCSNATCFMGIIF